MNKEIVSMTKLDFLFMLEHSFKKYVSPRNEETVYWRECIDHADILPDAVGYLWVWENGDILHSYKTPEQVSY